MKYTYRIYKCSQPNNTYYVTTMSLSFADRPRFALEYQDVDLTYDKKTGQMIQEKYSDWRKVPNPIF